MYGLASLGAFILPTVTAILMRIQGWRREPQGVGVSSDAQWRICKPCLCLLGLLLPDGCWLLAADPPIVAPATRLVLDHAFVLRHAIPLILLPLVLPQAFLPPYFLPPAAAGLLRTLARGWPLKKTHWEIDRALYIMKAHVNLSSRPLRHQI